MSTVYPTAPPEPAPENPLDDQTIVDRIIANRQASPKCTKEQLVGYVMTGGTNIHRFYGLWKEVEQERLAFTAVNPADFSTVGAFKAKLGKHKKWLDEVAWYSALKEAHDVTSFLALQAVFAPAEM